MINVNFTNSLLLRIIELMAIADLLFGVNIPHGHSSSQINVIKMFRSNSFSTQFQI